MKDLLIKKPEELAAYIKEKKEALQAFRFSMGGSKIKNVREGRMARKEVARALTILNNKQISK